MKLIKLIERSTKDWNLSQCLPNEMKILQPNAEDLEKAIANCNINDIDTLIVYKD